MKKSSKLLQCCQCVAVCCSVLQCINKTRLKLLQCCQSGGRQGAHRLQQTPRVLVSIQHFCSVHLEQCDMKLKCVSIFLARAGGASSAANTVCISIYSAIFLGTPRAVYIVETCWYLFCEGRGRMVCCNHHVC